ncbi:MAG: precorrin-3B C(17)-methyltransferase [Euryarchaeota archaeon]|nr:precorrin-3B C(17)-methyltransferase [Euryarchaeota archaeon]
MGPEPRQNGPGKIYLVGFGPGAAEHLTTRAARAIRESDVVVGYTTYIELVKDFLVDKEVIQTGMQEEVGRAARAVEMARQGRTVSVISSGDAGVYGMAGLVFEVLGEQGWKPGDGLEVEVVPGVTALCSVASLLGAPLVHDFASISLSDLLTPWEVIAERIEAAARADYVIVLYNPKSGRRTRQIAEAQKIISRYRAPATPVGIVKSAYRQGQQVAVTDLAHMLDHDIGMLTTLIIGNSTTYRIGDLIVTPRGYKSKYDLSKTARKGEGEGEL